ncbi:MAG TPA: 4-hydroxy-tetrahydrodipicolinate synthase [Sphingobacteriaceae bacterium]
MSKFYGSGVAMVTPFNSDGSVDFNGLGNLINYIIDGGIEYLVSLGTTGETATLTREEKQSVWEFTAETVAGRVPLVAGIGGNNTREVAATMDGFRISGYDAILSVSPYYNKPTQEGIYQHYKTLAGVSPLPLILYNVPGRTGSNMTAETTLRLAHDFQNIIGIKEASANFDQFNRIVRDKPEDFLFISGDDPIALQMIAMGAAGVISVVGNAIPSIFSTMVRMCLDGRFAEALPLHYSLIEVTNLFFAEGNPAGVKAALNQLGICGDRVRLPLVNISAPTENNITEELRQLGLLK